MTTLKIGITRERKSPSDRRVPLTPSQCAILQDRYGIEVAIEPSAIRCFSDAEYRNAGIAIADNLRDCDVLLGVKEPKPEYLIPHKTYFLFSHTIKAQPYNRNLLIAIKEKGIRLIDYEVLTDSSGNRVIAFGYFAGVVGAHNGIWTWQRRHGFHDLPRLHELTSFDHVRPYYRDMRLAPVKIALTGTGRVSSGAVETLRTMGLKQVPPESFTTDIFSEAVFTQVDVEHFFISENGTPFDKAAFFRDPVPYRSNFSPYYNAADILINGIYWDPKSPALFTAAEMASKAFRIRVIADITCDIAPESSVPSTIRPSTIDNPVYGYDPSTNQECLPFDENYIDVMAIDNLPNEIARDASLSFGEQFIEHVIPDLLSEVKSEMLERATICNQQQLGPYFQYLQDYIDGTNDKN